jgi:tRNA U34 5-carboxymethylaminomethyl modifying enzyme MnmG/GidA
MGDVRADTGRMDETSLDELRKELAELEVQEQRLSAERDRLHHQIDFGFQSASTSERELEVSAARRELHQRIDVVRKILDSQHVD